MLTAERWIELLEQHAGRLHAAGITSIQVDGASATIAAAPPPAPDIKTDDHPMTANPLDDPALYPDGRVPGYTLMPESRDSE